jgi:hypothetical protein
MLFGFLALATAVVGFGVLAEVDRPTPGLWPSVVIFGMLLAATVVVRIFVGDDD